MDNPERVTYFAATDSRGKRIPFGIKQKDRSRHMYVIGKTGMGKSTLLENLAIQDIRNGEGLAFIDPHGATADTLLNYIPPERVKDVVHFAPFDMDNPIAFNVMEDVGYDKRHLVVSGLMATFKKIWVDAWSARMEYILTNTLLALLEYPGATLLGVNRMYTDKPYRKLVVDNIKDPVVKDFWVKEFATYTDRYTQEATPAIQNKIGQFTGNPLIRNIIGQPKSSFDIREMMDQKKILIINLSKGQVGDTNTQLLGSMLTTRIFLAAMSRADLSATEIDRLPHFYFYVDEFQNFANETFAEILSESRKYKLNLTIAHQYIEQMEEEVRAAVFGNVGTTICFRVGPFDAEVLETIFMPTFTKEDLVNLGRFQMYLSLMIDGVGSPPFSALSIPRIEAPQRTFRAEVIAESRKQFATARGPIEEAIAAELKINPDAEYQEPEPKRKTTTYRKPTGGDYPPRPRAPRAPEMNPARELPQAPANMMVSDHEERPRPPRPQLPRRDTRPAPAAGQKSAEDLRAILRRMTEEANKGKSVKAAEKQQDIRTSVAKATAPNPPTPPNPRPAPPAPTEPPPAPPRPPEPVAGEKSGPQPFEVPEADLRNLFKNDI
ncbi:MAG TPA: type IV secretion system DNA-binding domain-containing protein [Candidatus Paceibacterota bacterium]|nr:type IV secretion system DNA-binding domain-containing protein [Candidatus Paceibacterota bacterium]